MANNNPNEEYEGYRPPTIEISNGRVFIDGKETTDVNLIGLAIIDFAENQDLDGMKIVLKEQDVFVESLITEV